MSNTWVVRLAQDNVSQDNVTQQDVTQQDVSQHNVSKLGRLWQRPSLEICQEGDSIWLRASQVDEDLERELRMLPGQAFQVLNDGQLRAPGKLVPQGFLPDGPWSRLTDWMQIEFPPPAFGGEVTSAVSLKLMRGGPVRTPLPEANVLLTERDLWRDFAATAPVLRLNLWSFAMSDEQALIMGNHLPPLPGERYVETAGIAAPCGWTWSPALDALVIRQAFGLADGDLALLRPDGWWDHIRADDFVQATRASVRASCDREVSG